MHAALVHMRHGPSGGTERYLDQLSAHLARAGHEVTVVCRSHGAPSHPSIRFRVLRSPAVGGAWRMWAFARAVERHVARERYDIVVGLGKTWSQDVLRLGGGSHASYVELAHAETLSPLERALGKGRLKNALALAIERRALRPGAYRRVIANSRMVAEDVRERYGVPEERLAVIYNGVDIERFHPRLRGGPGIELRRALGIESGAPVVLFLGSGYGRKGLSELLEAFATLARERGDLRLLVAGRDSSQRAFEARARRLGIERACRFLGPRSDPETCYAAADLSVLPTRYDPFANTTLEALASGLPVITTATNGASELLAGGREGSVLPRERGPEALLAELRAWCDRDRLAAAAPAARALAERHSEPRAMQETSALLATFAMN